MLGLTLLSKGPIPRIAVLKWCLSLPIRMQKVRGIKHLTLLSMLDLCRIMGDLASKDLQIPYQHLIASPISQSKV